LLSATGPVKRQGDARGAARFLATCQQRMPFPIRGIQVDSGSEFYAAFEAA
jgi:hypothetical protein